MISLEQKLLCSKMQLLFGNSAKNLLPIRACQRELDLVQLLGDICFEARIWSDSCDSYGFRVSDRKYFSGADDLIQQLWIQIALWPVILLPGCSTLPSISLFTGNMSALEQGLVITLHLHNVQSSEPPATWAMQVHTDVSMSPVAEGDNAVDEGICRRGICMINICPKFSMTTLCCCYTQLCEVFPCPFLLPAGRSGFMSLLWCCVLG